MMDVWMVGYELKIDLKDYKLCSDICLQIKMHDVCLSGTIGIPFGGSCETAFDLQGSWTKQGSDLLNTFQ